MAKMAENRGGMEKALKNPLILHTIFSQLNDSDLLDCRLVNRLNWFDLATRILHARRQIEIDYNFSDELGGGKCSLFANSAKNPWSLKSLVDCIKESNFFPCFRFRFSQGYLDDKDLIELFSIYGDSIVELQVDLIARSNIESTIERFGEILWKQLPNLEKLTIWKAALGWSLSSRLFSKAERPLAKLEKLKYFNYEKSLENGQFKFIDDIQNAAPNLVSKNVQKISFVAPKMQTGSNLISGDAFVSNLTFSPEKLNMRFYERLVRTKPKFFKIIINLENARKQPELLPKVKTILTEILNSSQSSLRQLDGVIEISCLSEMQLTSFEFPHVRRLNLQTHESGSKICTSTFNLDFKSVCKSPHSFPSLSEVGLESLNFLQNCQDSIQTVKKLTSGAVFSSPGDFQKVATIFPMLENLELDYIKNFQQCAKSLWKYFGQLTNLKIGILVEKDSQVSMDKAFLGTETIPSISELRELRTLHVTFIPIPQNTESGCKNGKGKWTRWNFLGKSTVHFALQKLKQLHSIDLIVDARKTDFKDTEEIYKQTEELKLLANVQFRVMENQIVRNKNPSSFQF